VQYLMKVGTLTFLFVKNRRKKKTQNKTWPFVTNGHSPKNHKNNILHVS
jgi:hypothetical protein